MDPLLLFSNAILAGALLGLLVRAMREDWDEHQKKLLVNKSVKKAVKK